MTENDPLSVMMTYDDLARIVHVRVLIRTCSYLYVFLFVRVPICTCSYSYVFLCVRVLIRACSYSCVFLFVRGLENSSVGLKNHENIINLFYHTKWPFVVDRMHV